MVDAYGQKSILFRSGPSILAHLSTTRPRERAGIDTMGALPGITWMVIGFGVFNWSLLLGPVHATLVRLWVLFNVEFCVADTNPLLRSLLLLTT